MRVIVRGFERDLTVEELYREVEAFMLSKANEWNLQMSFEEKMSVCKIAFMKLTKTYKLEKGAFITALGTYIKNEFNNIVKENNSAKRADGYEVSINETVGRGRDEKELTIEDTLEDSKSSYGYDRIERMELIKQILLELTEEEREFVYHALIEKKKQKELSEMYGTVQSNINKRINKIKSKLQHIVSDKLVC